MKTRLAALFIAATFVVSTPSVAQFMDINSIIAEIGSTEFLDDAADVDGASAVRVVRLSSLAGARQSAGRLANARSLKARNIDYLQGSLIINPIAVTAIRNANVGLDQIVSLSMSGDGAAVLFADDL